MAPGAMSPIAQDRTCDPTAPMIEHAEAVWASRAHVTPVNAGSGSSTATAVAVPGPPLDTVIVKPTGEPAVTGVASAVLVMARLGSSGGGEHSAVHGGVVTTMIAK